MGLRIPFFIVAGLLASLIGALDQAHAQRARPFAIVGSGIAPDGLPLPGMPGREHWSVGAASLLGIYFGDGAVQTDSAVPQPDGTLSGEFGSAEPFVFRGLSGNLATYYGRTDFGATSPGEVTLSIVDVLPDGSLVVTARFVAEFVVQSNASTRRFKGATGSWTMIANTEPFVLGSSDPLDYWWYGFGTITTRR